MSSTLATSMPRWAGVGQLGLDHGMNFLRSLALLLLTALSAFAEDEIGVKCTLRLSRNSEDSKNGFHIGRSAGRPWQLYDTKYDR